MNTPCFVIREQALNNNIKTFFDSFDEYWENSKLCYSVKTNSLPWILKYLKHKSILAEVVSDEEYNLAKLCGYDDSEIVYNGPIKSEKKFKEACDKGAYVNIDSKNDLNYIEKYKPNQARIGIRVNVPTCCFDELDIDYVNDGFRFGFSDENEEFEVALKTVINNCKDVRLGLHLHCNSKTRSVSVYSAIAKYAVHLIKKYNLKLDFIDLGGGFFGGVENKPDAGDYVKAIKEELFEVIDIKETILLVEPGSAIIGSCVDLYSSVIDVKNTDKSRIVTTDASRLFLDPLWGKASYMFEIISDNKEAIEKQIICGYTCMDHDRIMQIYNEKELCIGDTIVYHRVGAYTITMSAMFIRYFPEVYVDLKENGMMLVRKKINENEYFSIHSK